MDLAVGVRWRDMVEVDQRNAAHGVACQRLGRPAAHAANADHADAGRLQPGHACRPVQPRHAAETAVVVVVLGGLVGQGLGQAGQAG
ncbi:hypothetical protein D3C87_1320490 [compost metagenome]